MEQLPPIPSPPGHLWRLFCHRALPLLVFVGAAVAVGALWRHQGGGRTLVAVGEGARAHVLAPQVGSLVEILVPPYAEVRRGDPVAILRAYDPRGELDRARLELEMRRLQSAPSLAEERAVDLERLRLDLARVRSELATARVRLDFATREADRLEPLFRERLITEDLMELSRGTRDMNAAEVREKEKLMREVEARLQELELRDALAGAPGAPAAAGAAGAGGGPAVTGPALTGGVWAPPSDAAVTNLTLVAPIDGTVGAWLRRPGEYVVEGEPLISISSRRADWLVGYLRQPIAFEPEVGMEVKVTRRTFPPTPFASVIRHVGNQFESISNALAVIRVGMLVDVGLPVVVDVPDGQPIRPGELVDVVIRTGSPRAPASMAVTSPTGLEP